ncbi:hypothetical protein BV20DRAFT_458963 [Pilatotrama ljubarskyi]|nr:hypothetical protein BV20DRAFT_458963 [Pilatotrama ljubarskyi]
MHQRTSGCISTGRPEHSPGRLGGRLAFRTTGQRMAILALSRCSPARLRSSGARSRGGDVTCCASWRGFRVRCRCTLCGSRGDTQCAPCEGAVRHRHASYGHARDASSASMFNRTRSGTLQLFTARARSVNHNRDLLFFTLSIPLTLHPSTTTHTSI